MSKKVFAFDMDGTILNRDGIILPETIKALKEATDKGHIAALCSGRPYFDMIDIANKAGVFDYMICNNGAYFFDMKSNSFHIAKEVNKEVALEVLALGKEHNTFFAVHTDKGVYRAKLWENDPMWAASEIKSEWHKFELVDPKTLPSIIAEERVTQVSLRATKEIIDMLEKYCVKFSHAADIHIAGEVYLDVNPLETSKLTGINDLGKHISLSAKDFVAFGDSGNDLQMLKGAGLGVCMGNGTPEAKEAAHVVIGDNNSDAIAKKIRELI